MSREDVTVKKRLVLKYLLSMSQVLANGSSGDGIPMMLDRLEREFGAASKDELYSPIVRL